MTKNKQWVFMVILMAFIFASCRLEKRVYMKGYHVEWKKKGKLATQNDIAKAGLKAGKDKLNAKLSANDRQYPFENLKESDRLMASADQSLFETNAPKKRHALISEKARVNDKRTVVNTKAATVVKQKQNKKNKAGAKGESDEKIIALILCFFLGLIGIHRFYLGYPLMGILYIFTAGLCGIGVLVDFILILTGGLTRKT